MQPENLSYGDLIHRRGPFVIPPYQRAYAWKREDIEDFVGDIDTLVKKRETENSYQHFFGGIVCVHSFVQGTPAGEQFLVIDGQQRLATFAMVLALIIRELEQISRQARESVASAHAKNIKASYLEYSSVNKKGQALNLPRLVLSKVDKDFFSYLLWNLQPPTHFQDRDSHKLLKSAWNKLRRGLIKDRSNPELSFEERIQNLLNLQTVITDGCHMIHIISTDRSEAYRLFMTLNDRGRSLGAGDLLKSYTLELLEESTDSQDSAETKWTQILKEDDNKVEAFLRSYYPSITGERAGRLTLYDDYCKDIFSFDAALPPQLASQELSYKINELAQESVIYDIIAKGEWPYENSTTSLWSKNRLSRLTEILRHTRCYPLLLAAKHCLAEDRFAEIVQILEFFVFRYVIVCKNHQGKLEAPYYNHCRRIREQKENYIVEGLRNDLKALLAEDESDLHFESSLVQRLTYSPSGQGPQRILHFLSTLEDFRRWYDDGHHGEPRPTTTAVFDIASLQVEHIYSQNAGNSNAHLEPLKHHIGNLSFWSGEDNRTASNADFKDKKSRYADSSVSFNCDLALLNTWDIIEFHERQSKLVDMATKIFTI